MNILGVEMPSRKGCAIIGVFAVALIVVLVLVMRNKSVDSHGITRTDSSDTIFHGASVECFTDESGRSCALTDVGSLSFSAQFATKTSFDKANMIIEWKGKKIELDPCSHGIKCPSEKEGQEQKLNVFQVMLGRLEPGRDTMRITITYSKGNVKGTLLAFEFPAELLRFKKDWNGDAPAPAPAPAPEAQS